MKARGIYTELSFYFPLWFDVKGHYGIAGFDRQKNKKPFALLFFDPRMREIHRSWLRQLLTTPNPCTGRTLAKETALAIVEIVNEDSFFFWTYTAADVIDRHGYFGGRHTGQGSHYSVRVGHAFGDRAGVTEPRRLPIQVDQVAV